MSPRTVKLVSASLAALAAAAAPALPGGAVPAAPPSAKVTFAEASRPAEGIPPVTAIGIKSDEGRDAGPAHVLVLVDTSASQAGEYRRQGLDAVAGLLEKARPDDRFAIAAVDVTCTPLLKEFKAARDPATAAAARSLDARTPLGSTDIVAALTAAACAAVPVSAKMRRMPALEAPSLRMAKCCTSSLLRAWVPPQNSMLSSFQRALEGSARSSATEAPTQTTRTGSG